MNRNKIAIVLRSVYGARNAFAFIVSAIEDYFKPMPPIYVADNTNIWDLVTKLKGRDLNPIVFYSLSTHVFIELKSEIRILSSKGIKIIAGGPHAAGAYWQVLRAGAEIAVIGDGENATIAALEYFSGEIDISDIPNIAYKEGDRFKTTRMINIRLDDYKPYSRTLKLFPPIEIMRGCSYRCLFCQVPFLFKGKVRYRGLESISEAVSYYVAQGHKLIRFIAPIGLAYKSPDGRTPNPEAIEQLLLAVRSRGGRPFLGTFPSETRPEQVTPEILKILYKLAENRRLAIGLQSGSNKLLHLVKRGHTVEEGIEAARLALKYGFKPVIDIIMGLPGETEDDIVLTIKVMEKLVKMGARIRLHTFMPLPGTPLARTKPRGIHPLYKSFIRKMLGRGVLEGDWELQEKLAWRIYEIMKNDPLPTPIPSPQED